MSYRVTVNHAHVFPPAINPNGTIDRLLKLMDACGIEEAVCFAPFAYQIEGKGIADQNKWLAAELKKYKRLYGFGTVDPRRDDLREQVWQAHHLGLKGLKLHPNAQKFDILSPKIKEVYGAAQELGLFITFHSGVHQSKLSETNVMKFDDVAWEFPNLKFSMEHVGGYHFFEEALAVIFNHVPPPWETGKCNVFAGLASVFTPNHNRFWYLSNDKLTELAAQVGVAQMIMGLDFPYNLENETKVGLETIRSLFDEPEQAAILGGNLRRELSLPEL
jgi:predicted TIM-barrel fold metal-dependent hydrolase